MAAFWAVFTFGGSGPPLTAHGSLDLKQEIQIQIQTEKCKCHEWFVFGVDIQHKFLTANCGSLLSSARFFPYVT
jgi:hypothetical protein